jgi:Family of unknown function (DUF6503)
MKRLSGLLIALIIPVLSFAQQTAEELIAASIQFHDPGNNWSKTKAMFNFSDTRPGKEARPATLYLNNTTSTLCVMREQEGSRVTRHTEHDNFTYDVNGNFKPSEEEIEQYNLNEKRTTMMRNYYLYLWGLPMKLTDPGTRVDPMIYDKKFDGKVTKAVRVTYDEEVGKDIWYFYFDPGTSEMVGYQFYYDEAKNDGEYILISDLINVNGMKIPKNRTWYTNADSTLLGTDHLISTEALVHSH